MNRREGRHGKIVSCRIQTRFEIREIPADMCQCESSPNSTNEVKNKHTSIENRNRQISKIKAVLGMLARGTEARKYGHIS